MNGYDSPRDELLAPLRSASGANRLIKTFNDTGFDALESLNLLKSHYGGFGISKETNSAHSAQ